MGRTFICCIAVLLAAGAARADDTRAAKEAKTAKDAKGPKGDKLLSGMSIVGNDDAPKSLVIVPWKTSGLGETLDVDSLLDDGAQPVDRDVFARQLSYYRITAESQGGGGSGKQ